MIPMSGQLETLKKVTPLCSFLEGPENLKSEGTSQHLEFQPRWGHPVLETLDTSTHLPCWALWPPQQSRQEEHLCVTLYLGPFVSNAPDEPLGRRIKMTFVKSKAGLFLRVSRAPPPLSTWLSPQGPLRGSRDTRPSHARRWTCEPRGEVGPHLQALGPRPCPCLCPHPHLFVPRHRPGTNIFYFRHLLLHVGT